MALFPPQDDNAVFVSRTEVDDPLSSYAPFSFDLESAVWPSVEHYFQAMKFLDPQRQQKIRQAKSPHAARRLGRSRFKRIRSDWHKVREVVMTRAVYIKCRSHQQVAEILLASGDRRIVERSMYDYFWGCGRDGRGKNAYGQVLMNVRNKLREERAAN